MEVDLSLSAIFLKCILVMMKILVLVVFIHFVICYFSSYETNCVISSIAFHHLKCFWGCFLIKWCQYWRFDSWLQQQLWKMSHSTKRRFCQQLLHLLQYFLPSDKQFFLESRYCLRISYAFSSKKFSTILLIRNIQLFYHLPHASISLHTIHGGINVSSSTNWTVCS